MEATYVAISTRHKLTRSRLVGLAYTACAFFVFVPEVTENGVTRSIYNNMRPRPRRHMLVVASFFLSFVVVPWVFILPPTFINCEEALSTASGR